MPVALGTPGDRGDAMEEKRPTIAELMDFPCDHVFKAFGPGTGRGAPFAAKVHQAVCEVVVVPDDALKLRESRQSGYVCVSVLVHVVNADQVAGIYSALKKVEGLLFLL
ncbi:MAG TPA: hypothetical protein DEB35_10920 [Desulfuromonas sp.]|nr:hypothetical protein [Desulfuromonas sp.]